MKDNSNNLLPVSIKNLNYVRGGRRLLNRVSCEIRSKGITVILGPNGAGKTLLLKCMHGLINFDTPRIFYAENTLDKRIRMQQSMVFQNPILLRRSVKNNLLFVLKQRKIKLKEELILKVLKKLDLLSLVNEKAIFLSGGEKQRLSLARAIITEPKILFLDEATSSLDVNTESQILDELKIFKEKTIISIAHRINTLKNCDKIYRFDNGKVIDEGNFDKFKIKGA